MKNILIILFMFLITTTYAQTPCPVKGDSKNPKMWHIDSLKNRQTTPKHIDQVLNLDSMLHNPNDMDRSKDTLSASIEGVFILAKSEGGETCNCHSEDNDQHDIHCYISTTLTADKGQMMVVELTPYFRQLYPEWTLAYLNSLKGHKVRITGWRLADIEHFNISRQTCKMKNRVERGTIQEIHPITSIDILN